MAFMKHSHSLERKEILPTEFLLAIVHELKTPILSILSLADLLKDELKTIKTNKNFNSNKFSQEFNEYVQDISLVATEMNELVGDIIDVKSAAFSKNFSVDLSQEIDLRNVIKRSVKLNYDYSLKRGVAIKTEIADDIKPIKLDAKRLKQILTNLISNAVKYSPKNSEVKITAKNLSQNNQEFLEICVIDQGFGITETQIATAFEKYQTIQNPNSKSVDSFGLGLPIVKELVSLQRGIIKLESKPKKETLVRLSFFYQNLNEIKNNSNPQQE